MASGTGGVAYLNPEAAKKFNGSTNNMQGMTFIYGNQGATRLDLIRPGLEDARAECRTCHGNQRSW